MFSKKELTSSKERFMRKYEYISVNMDNIQLIILEEYFYPLKKWKDKKYL